jgi:rhodanese-related sulfurtransferase
MKAYLMKLCCILGIFLTLPELYVPAICASGTHVADTKNNTHVTTKPILKLPPERVAKTLKKRDHSLFISAESVLSKIKQKQKIVFIDVRNPTEFETVRIPGSINIPLYFIKSRAFLKLEPLVLVNTGYPCSQMEEEFKRLRDKGFKARILRGGILSWYHSGGQLKGDLFALNGYNKISPRSFFQEKDYTNQIVLDVSKEHTQASKQLIPYATHIPFFNNLNLRDLRAGALNKADTNYFLIFNENGDHYEKIEKIMRKKGLENTFYLTGGLDAYEKYLQHLVLSMQPRDSRIQGIDKCKNCGPAKETK